MYRTLAMIAALVLTTITVSSAGFAHGADNLSFALHPGKAADRVQLSLRGGNGDRDTHMSNSFAARDLAGLDLAALRSWAPAQVRFALVREAGRVDCSGSASRGHATGGCGFTPDQAFADFLASRGISRPDRDHAFTLAMVGTRRDLVEALRSARYPTPTIDDLTALSALGVDRGFVDVLASRGYRPRKLDELVQFAALGVTPDYIDGLARAGYRDIGADGIVQFKALGVTPDYLAELAAKGYRNLGADEVVQLKALGVGGQFVSELERNGIRGQSVDQLVKLRVLGFMPAPARNR